MKLHNPSSPHFSLHSGLSCLIAIGRRYNKNFDETILREIRLDRDDYLSMISLARIAEKSGFKARIVKLSYLVLVRKVAKPCILYLGLNKYVVLYKGDTFALHKRIACFDPIQGKIKYPRQEFLRQWLGHTDKEDVPDGEALLIEPAFNFYGNEQASADKLSWKVVLRYFRKNREQVAQVFISLLIASALQIIFPFLIQSIVDVGINTQNVSYIAIVLLGQLVLVFSRALIDFIRGRLLLHISTMVNLSIISDFWIKLTRLPLTYFEQNHTGSILQRINDNKQLQNFLTGPALTTIYSIFNFLIFAVILIMYRLELFLIFTVGLILYVLWMLVFLKIRRKLNYRIFESSSRENNATLQLIQGMSEIRLQNLEQPKRWEWEKVQEKIFSINFKILTIDQLQQAGVIIINQGKDVVLLFIMAKLVIDGELTLGALLALQFIIGQLSWPIEQLVGIIPVMQDAKISMERLNQVHLMADEENKEMNFVTDVPPGKDIVIADLSFTYRNGTPETVLKDIHLTIPYGKITAIVGSSGSGKTTLLKLLLKFYEDYSGEIRVGDQDFKQISHSAWRNECGAVWQEGFIFNDTIAKNIAVEYEKSDEDRLIAACKTVNILSFIESLPDGFDTLLGVDGMGISQGQKQRLLIARAVYKDPAYLFFDESTNALDSKNERLIVENFKLFFESKTVVVVAHRLSTVKYADKIVVLHKGRVVEEGCHRDLIGLRGRYYDLVRNQLEVEY